MKKLFVFALAAWAAPGLFAADLAQILAKMDESAAGFEAMAADVEWIGYTALVDDKTVESGTMTVRRSNGKVELMVHFTEPYERQLLIKGTKVESYKPRINTVEEYDISKHKDKIEQALLLGFGVSGKYLSENYLVALGGQEAIDGKPTVRLDLTPKSDEMKRSVPKIEMWVSTETWQPVRQKLHQTSKGDYRIYAYSNIRINPDLKSSDFKLKTSGKVNRIRPQ